MGVPAIRIEVYFDPEAIKATLDKVFPLAEAPPKAAVVEAVKLILAAATPKLAQETPKAAQEVPSVPEPPPPAEPVPPPPEVPPEPVKPDGGQQPFEFKAGDAVWLNNPNPPLGIRTGNAVHVEIQQFESGQLVAVRDDGSCVVRWDKAPGFQVPVPASWLLPAVGDKPAVPVEEPDETFPEPYDQQTTEAYAAYVKRWLDKAIRKNLTKEQVQERWNSEGKTIRTKLGAFPAGIWHDMGLTLNDAMTKLSPAP